MDDLLEIAVHGNFNFEDIEDAMLHEILMPRQEIRIRSTKYDVEDAILNEILMPRQQQEIRIRSTKYGRLNIAALTPEECRLYFRFEKDHLPRLVNYLGIPEVIETEQLYSTTGIEGLCIYLRRLAYPNRLSDLEPLFGLSAPYLSVISNKIMNIIHENKGHLLTNLNNLPWLNRNKLRTYSETIALKGAPMQNCWGFIDGTARAICRPSVDQEEYYSGHKRQHCVKYQSVLCPDGIVVSLHGAYPGRKHDAGIFRDSNFYTELEQCTSFENGEKYALYGDCAYPIRELLLCPYSNRNLTPEQHNFNTAMSSMRQAVEWGFGKIIGEFAFLDFKKNQKLLLQEISMMYTTGMILSNCHTCLYGSQTAQYYNIQPPTLEEYLCIQG